MPRKVRHLLNSLLLISLHNLNFYMMRLFTLDNVAGSISGVNCGVGGSMVKKQIIIIISKILFLSATSTYLSWILFRARV
jgi:hypothetical protein